MASRRADLLLHPVRLRIVLAALGRSVTTADLAGALPDVPQASLYRHVAALADAGILEVSAERPVRGTVERTYRVGSGAASLTGADAATMDAEAHQEAFAVFVGTLLESFGRYVESPDADLAADGAGYRQVPLWLDDDEFSSLTEELRAVLERYVDRDPGPDRRRRTLTTIVIPDPS